MHCLNKSKYIAKTHFVLAWNPTHMTCTWLDSIVFLLLPENDYLIHQKKYLSIYLSIYSTKWWKQKTSTIKLLLETLFLIITMNTGFTTDGICMNTMCAVSLVNHLRAVADAFSSFKDSSALLSNWEANFTKVKSF